MPNKFQKAGDNSSQMIAENVYITNGITEERAREINREMFELERKELSKEANVIAEERIAKFENELIPRMEKTENALNAFSDPDFQMELREAQKTAIRTGRDNDYALLSELLIRRINRGENKHIRIGLDKAIEIVDDLSDESLQGLTIVFAVGRYVPNAGMISVGLNVLDKLYGKLIVEELPSGINWIDNLELLNAIRIGITNFKTFDQIYSESLSGYTDVGIKKESESYSIAVDLMKEFDLPSDVLVDHELNDGYVRVPVTGRNSIKEMTITKINAQNGVASKVITHLTAPQIIAVEQIYDMYDKDATKKENIKVAFRDMMNKYTYLSIVSKWLPSVNPAFELTGAGRAIAFANAKRLDPEVPDLDQ